jgi:hypothetical protein
LHDGDAYANSLFVELTTAVAKAWWTRCVDHSRAGERTRDTREPFHSRELAYFLPPSVAGDSPLPLITDRGTNDYGIDVAGV